MRIAVRPLLALLFTGLISQAGFAMECPMLVVAASSSPVDHMTRQELRRLYLGVPYQTRYGGLKPVLNEADSMLREVFLQKILFMSRNAYQRALATRLVQLGEAGPAEFRDTNKLIQALLSNPTLVSYLWSSQQPGDGSLKVLLEVPCEND